MHRVARWVEWTETDEAIVQDMTPEMIIERLTEKGEDFARMVWVGKNYSKADLLRDLRALVRK